MAFYQAERTMKSAAIGTIMPWTGDFGAIPRGWLVCSGQTIVAKEYPLLAQVIGTQYGISSGFGGTFPDYTGTIFLPNLNDKHLANIDTDYFVAGQTVDNTSTDNAEALNVVTNYIGENENTGSLPPIVSDAYTDIVLNYTAENDFSGQFTGYSIIAGESERLIHISPRKLGRRHILGHNHSGKIETISGVSNERPGKGVIPWSNITFEVRDYFYAFGPEYNFTANPGPNGFSNGFGGTSFGKILANVESSDNNSNVVANNVASASAHPIANWLGNSSGKTFSNTVNYDGVLNRSESIPYGFGGSNVTIPQRNYDPGGTNSGVSDSNTSGNKVLYNKSSIDFNFNDTNATGGADQYITPHTHDSFDCVYDPANLKLPNKTLANSVTSNITPDNAAGIAALNLTAVLAQPNVICLYLIRAF
jgi:hypothetical protein